MKKNVLTLVFLALLGIGAATLQADSASKLLFDDGQFSYHCKTYAIRLVVKEDFTGNYFYDGDSVEMTKVKKPQNNSHLVPNKGDSEAPIRSLLWYFKNVNSKRYYSLSVYLQE